MSEPITVIYLSEKGALEKAIELTGLAADEIEKLVGRFGKQSARYKELRGKIIIGEYTGKIEIRDDWNNKLYWRKEVGKRPFTRKEPRMRATRRTL